MTLGSLFDGIGVWQLAAVEAGIKPVWSSEIDDFACAVSKNHFPTTTQLGNINNITDVPKVDVITASSPCQDISIAGKLGGIHCERSGLFFKAIELVRRSNAEFFVWENVPHVISRREDFQAVLEAVTQTEIPIPERGFTNAGVVDFDGGQLAYRICDAQFWGVAQRRRRVFLVADFAGRRAAEILFEHAGLPRNSPTGTAQKQGVAARTRTDSDFAVYEHHGQDSRIKRLGNVAPTVAAKYGTGGLNTPLVAYGLQARYINRNTFYDRQGLGINTEISFTLTANDRHAVAYGIGRDAFNQGTNAKFNPTVLYEVCPPLMARGAAAVAAQSIVRRLTPVECERLMGLPDNFTAYGSDSKRYKALGNALVLPVATWILKRIKEART